jgi:predicted unusual protein kinase regulating ubiquinone biosynthesis (AarF/ABC1/UbiB family)
MNKFDVVALDNFYDTRPIVVFKRVVDIGLPILLWYMNCRADNILSKNDVKQFQKRANELKDAIVAGKSVTLIKCGQALSLRPDIVKSEYYIQSLSKLQDEVGAFDNKIAMKIIEDELGSFE